MAYTLSNKCAKNLCKRTVLLQFIIKNVVTCFLEHSVDGENENATDVRLRDREQVEKGRAGKPAGFWLSSMKRNYTVNSCEPDFQTEINQHFAKSEISDRYTQVRGGSIYQKYKSPISIVSYRRHFIIVVIASQHTDAIDVCPSVCPSLRPSVCPFVRYVSVVYENGLKYCHSHFYHTLAQLF